MADEAPKPAQKVAVQAAPDASTRLLFLIGKQTHEERQGSLYFPFGGNQTIQIYGNFQGFPNALFGLVI